MVTASKTCAGKIIQPLVVQVCRQCAKCYGHTLSYLHWRGSLVKEYNNGSSSVCTLDRQQKIELFIPILLWNTFLFAWFLFAHFKTKYNIVYLNDQRYAIFFEISAKVATILPSFLTHTQCSVLVTRN